MYVVPIEELYVLVWLYMNYMYVYLHSTTWPVVSLQLTGYTLPYDELPEVRARLLEIAPHLVRYDDLEPANFFALTNKLMKVRW